MSAPRSSKMRRETVPQCVRARARGRGPSRLQVLLQHAAHAARRQPAAEPVRKHRRLAPRSAPWAKACGRSCQLANRPHGIRTQRRDDARLRPLPRTRATPSSKSRSPSHSPTSSLTRKPGRVHGFEHGPVAQAQRLIAGRGRRQQPWRFPYRSKESAAASAACAGCAAAGPGCPRPARRAGKSERSCASKPAAARSKSLARNPPRSGLPRSRAGRAWSPGSGSGVCCRLLSSEVLGEQEEDPRDSS